MARERQVPHSHRRKLRVAAVLLLALVSWWSAAGSSQSVAGRIALVGGTVVDGTGAPPFTGTVLFLGERIEAVGPKVAIPKGTTIVDVSGQTVLPGLFDIHTHVMESPAGGGSSDWAKNLMAYVYSGVTSVTEFGSYAENFDQLRRLQVTRELVMPRLVLASRLAPPRGHGAESGRPSVHTREVLTPREAEAAMSAILGGPRPDVIKVFADGWRYGTGLDMDNIQPDTLRAIVDRAHGENLPVLTHTVTLSQARLAASVGVDMIGHSIGDRDLEPDVIDMVRSKDLTYVPTLSVYEPRNAEIPPLLAEVLEPAARDALARRKAAATATTDAGAVSRQRRFETMRRNVALMRSGGARIAVGTDAGMANTFHGWATLHELRLLVSAGLTPLEALTAATGNAARAVRVDRDRGTLAAGKLADLLVVSGRPHERIEDIENIRAVYMGGRLVDRQCLKDAIASPAPFPLASGSIGERLDDFEQDGGRAAGGQLWVDYTDNGHDRSRLVWTRSLRASGDHALLALARLGVKDQPSARLTLPLAGGGLLPVDASAYRGVTFDVRGEGAYRFVGSSRTRGATRPVAAGFEAGPEWKRIVIPFVEFTGEGLVPAWTKDLLSLAIELNGPAGSRRWLEIDNVAFVR